MENTIKHFFGICFLGVSLAMLSFYQLIYYSKWFVIFTVILSFVCWLYFVNKTVDSFYKYIKSNLILSLFILFISFILIYAMYENKGMPNSDKLFYPLPFKFFTLKWYMIALPGVFYLGIWFYRKISGFVIKFISELDLCDKKLYFMLTLSSLCFILGLYSTNPQWYLQYDIVYSIDSGYCSQKIFPVASYYDIRHPVLGIITFPIYATIRYILSFFVPEQLLSVLSISFVQLLNCQFLFLVGFMLGKMAHNRWVTLIYFSSFPVLLFSCFFEKYQICVFLLVLYVYKTVFNEKKSEINLLFASGAMSTSIFIFLYEIFIKEKFIIKMKKIVSLLLKSITFVICTGRIHLLVPVILWTELHNMADRFGLKNLSLNECFCSFTKMVHASFLGISSSVESKYIWQNITENISLLGTIFIICIIWGIYLGRQSCFMRICTIWFICSVLLIFVIQWGVSESPLFSIYFSWAIVPLFQESIQFFVEKFQMNEKILYTCIISLFLVINLVNIIDIGIFLNGL